MDSLHTGSDILIYIQTSCFSLTIKGTASHPSFPGVAFSEKESVLRITSDEEVDAIDLCGDHDMVSELHKEYVHVYEYQLVPLFFEQQRYEVIIEPEENHRAKFWHDNYNIRKKVTPTGRKGNLLTGEINFGNDIGLSDLLIEVDGSKHFKLTLEVFPSKINYKDDYKAIVSDITTEVYNLVFDFLKKTYSSFDVSSSQQSSMVEFFAIIRKIYDEFVRAADMILRNPHHQLISEHHVLPSYKVKKTDSATIKWLERHPENIVRGSDLRIRCDRALGVKKYVTYDTKENKLVKYMLSQTARRLIAFERIYCRKDKEVDPEIVSIVDSMIAGINRRCNTGVLKDIDAAAVNTGMSLVFGMAPGYRELYRSYLLLQHGLSVSGSLFDISVKDIAVLYEYWCFIKLNSIMRSKYKLVSQDIIKTSGRGLSVTLKKGATSKVKYINPSTGERIILSYNPSEQNLPTVPQIPDNVLRVEKHGANTDYEYVFDAKYRINPALPGSGYLDKTPGPEVDTINTMHRYRDAIVYQSDASPYERTMFGAYVLFPYHDENQYRNHRFYKSIKQVNIGGLPFLPTATSLVEDLIDELVSDSSESAFERTTLPRGIESRLAKVDWNSRDVLVGSVRTMDQLNTFIDNRDYYVDATLIRDDNFPIRYVALYQGRSAFGSDAKIEYYGEVKTAEKLSGADIDPALDDKPYYLFTVVEWKTLSRPIEPKEIGSRVMFTDLFLLQHSSQVPELYLNSDTEYRMFYELKRRTEASVINSNDIVEGISVGDYIISFGEGEILLSLEGTIRGKYEVVEFAKRPNMVFRRILDCIGSRYNSKDDSLLEYEN